MATYNDSQAISYWQALQDPENNGGLFRRRRCEPITPELARAAVEEEIHPATNRMVQNTHRMLLEMFGVSYASEPYIAKFRDWKVPPFGAGWWKWKQGYYVPEIVKKMRQPVAGMPIYVAGSGYSTVQGWVQGALNVAERLLQEKFALEWPEWLDKATYLGP